MKKIIFLSFFVLIPAAGLRADDDCGKASDACKAQAKKITPFMAELIKTRTAPALKQGSPTEPSLKQGDFKARPDAAPILAGADAPAAPLKNTVSNPAWLLAAAALLAGLYYFLKESKKRVKKT
jgi:hypothetical protein